MFFFGFCSLAPRLKVKHKLYSCDLLYAAEESRDTVVSIRRLPLPTISNTYVRKISFTIRAISNTTGRQQKIPDNDEPCLSCSVNVWARWQEDCLSRHEGLPALCVLLVLPRVDLLAMLAHPRVGLLVLFVLPRVGLLVLSDPPRVGLLWLLALPHVGLLFLLALPRAGLLVLFLQPLADEACLPLLLFHRPEFQ